MSNKIITKIEYLNKTTKMYDFTVDNKEHNYLISTNQGYVVSHNCLRGNAVNPSKMFSDDEQAIIGDLGKDEEGKDKVELIGGESSANEEYKVPGGCKLIKVPIKYKQDFKVNIEESLQDLAGECTSSFHIPIPTLGEYYNKNLAPEMIIYASVDDNKTIEEQIPITYFNNNGKWMRYPDCKHYCHCDLASTGRGALCILHKELSESGNIILVVDLLLDVISTTKIDVTKFVDFILDMKKKHGLNFDTITLDQYNSLFAFSILQREKAAPNVKHLSVESDEIYGMLASVIMEGRFKSGLLNLAEKQITNVQIVNKKPFIDSGILGHKDLSDVIVGATYNAVMNTIDYPTNYYELYDRYLNKEENIFNNEYEEI